MRREHFAPAAALAFMALSFSVIVYGRPVAVAYEWSIALVGVATVVLTFLDPLGRGRTVSFWPVIAILAAWGISIARSADPPASLGRTYGMGIYAMCFIAVQVIVWNPRTLRLLLWGVTLTILACVADVGTQWYSGSALFTGQPKRHFGFHGSQGNQNDLAVVSILLPLTSAALPGARGLALYIAMMAVSAPMWVLARSRQIALGWFIGALPPLAARVRIKWLIVIAIAMVGAIVAAAALSPDLRSRIMSTTSRGLGERGPIYGFGLWLFSHFWATGAGPGLFNNYYVPAAARGWTWMGEPLQRTGMPWVHSLPIEVLCETGLVGAAAVTSALVGAVRRLVRAWKHAATDRTLLMAIISAASCMMIVGLVDLTFAKDWVRICFWMILGLAFAMAPRGAVAVAAARAPAAPAARAPRGRNGHPLVPEQKKRAT
jgi:hypothetical protein